ncbi:MAG TPA: methyltransferase domain-containing protein [Enhygromyxa sp.]|nr:methyltransferase domain-containing protein [Enhygromyxa sp.]
MNESNESPEYADPNRYAELTGFDGEYRDLWWNRDFLELLARRWQLARRRELLDVGCGAGHWGLTVLGLMPSEARLTGVDAEPSFLARAHERATARGQSDRCRFELGRAEALPFADASFDVVCCQTLLIHVADASVAVAEMARVLRPGGILIASEPDNLAGNVALLGTSLNTPDEDVVAIVALLSTCMRGKRALGEGDERVGGRLPQLFADAGLTALRCHTNDRCMQLVPPYADPQMRATLDQELAWAAEGMAIISWTEHDARRLHEAGGGSAREFASGFAAVRRWLDGFVREVEARRFSSARGFVMYVASGEKPDPTG